MGGELGEEGGGGLYISKLFVAFQCKKLHTSICCKLKHIIGMKSDAN